MSSLSSSSPSSGKSLRGPELSDIFIKKPRTLIQSCPVETTTQRLPLIDKHPRRKKEVQKSRGLPEESWLKHGVSLPKLQTNEIPRSSCFRREEVSEPPKPSQYDPDALVKSNRPGPDVSQGNNGSKRLECFKNLPKTATEEEAGDSVEAVGPSPCDLDFRVPSEELNFDEFMEEEEPLEECHALKRWEHWVKEHKRQQNYLSKRLNRRKCDLQLQKAQNYRMMLEDKALLTGVQIPVADKWRGHPYQWKPDIKIGGPENSSFDEPAPEYYGVKTKLEKGEVPDLEFIGIPSSIKKEKSILCEDIGLVAGLTPQWMNLEYRTYRSKQLLEQSKILKPHDVQMDELEIVGKKISQEEQEKLPVPGWPANLPRIKVSPVQCVDSCSFDVYVGDWRVFWLSIGGVDLQYGIEDEYCQKIRKNKSDLKWEIDFGANPIGVLVERTLRVENKGTTAVEYKFFSQKPEKTQSLNPLQPIKHEPWLFFDKNPGIFLPGQIYNLKFYHQAKRPGVRKEIWHFQTQPPLTKDGENGTLIFGAVSTDDSSISDIKALDSYLGRQASRSVVAFILRLLLSKAMSPLENLRGIEYRSLFLEKELFEYQNSKHFYHSLIVKELHRLFRQVPQSEQPEWDLSLTSLTGLTTKYLNGKEREFLLREIADSAKKLLRPNRLVVKKNKKYRMCYEIFCKMVNFVEEDSDYLRSCLVEKRERVKKTSLECGEAEGELSGLSLSSGDNGEAGECDPEIVFQINPINFLYFQTMFYTKVYNRVVEAVENMAGVLETSKLLEPWRKMNYNPTKPSRGRRE